MKKILIILFLCCIYNYISLGQNQKYKEYFCHDKFGGLNSFNQNEFKFLFRNNKLTELNVGESLFFNDEEDQKIIFKSNTGPITLLFSNEGPILRTKDSSYMLDSFKAFRTIDNEVSGFMAPLSTILYISINDLVFKTHYKGYKVDFITVDKGDYKIHLEFEFYKRDYLSFLECVSDQHKLIVAFKKCRPHIISLFNYTDSVGIIISSRKYYTKKFDFIAFNPHPPESRVSEQTPLYIYNLFGKLKKKYRKVVFTCL
jgi:hypothetical protein